MCGVTFLLGVTWLTLSVWVGDHLELLALVAGTAIGPRTVLVRTRPARTAVTARPRG